MFKNLRELIVSMPTEEDCRKYMIEQSWGGCITCPYCGFDKKVYVIEGGKRFKCGSKDCHKKFSVTVGTIFEASNIPLSKWLMAIYIVTGHKKGISIAQKNSWFMLHRIREMMKNVTDQKLSGIVEVDETYMGRKYGSEYKAIPPEEVENMEFQPKKSRKGAAIGMKQRGGNIIVKASDKAGAMDVGEAVWNNVADDALLMTDEALKYLNVLADYKRESVNHSAGEWVRGNAHTNGVENYWSVMKRGVYGIYHQVSYKHLQNYCNEFTFRYNTREIKDCDRFVLSLQNIERRLTYKGLVGNNPIKSGKKDVKDFYIP